MFEIIIWRLWKQRNTFIFNGHVWLSMEIGHSAQAWDQAFKSSKESNHPSTVKRNTRQRWFPLKIRVAKLNTDGGANPRTIEATGGRVLKDSNGRRKVGFHRHIERCSTFQAEVWALYDGLMLAWNSVLQNVEVEIDNKEAVDTLNDAPLKHETALIRRVRELLQRQWNVKLSYVSREGNEVADAMAHQEKYEAGVNGFPNPACRS
ncbi:hypothetical protein F3Y22_tig00110716pilonHSYRG00263 [Hibiscus syriacus]|uniref:RNase H type-1 domain-containing protein n=1 Tax=Hibiscus syriacus TaxID=106335 RepID=A0A6A2ZVG9_HIBSY|nr:hypothetical protein F3Y22_tig00110716pilonHSYRG00263 [Hibiscus syriacus]